MPDRLPATTPIIVSNLFAGVLVTDDRRFRFVAVDRRFDVLDGSRFGDPEAARLSAARLADAMSEAGSADRNGRRPGWLRGNGAGRQTIPAVPRRRFSS